MKRENFITQTESNFAAPVASGLSSDSLVFTVAGAASKIVMLSRESKIESLKAALPHWTFAPYSKSAGCQIIACFPPKGPSMEAWTELETFCPIQSVCGPLYTVAV